jgi:DNA-binding NtrC family response regulator
MAAYHWPGNVRELKSILERAVLLRDGNDIRPSELLGLSNPNQVLPGPNVMDTTATPTLEEVETGYILQVLGKLNGNITRTADVLGMSLSTLKRKLKKNNSSSNRPSGSKRPGMIWPDNYRLKQSQLTADLINILM